MSNIIAPGSSADVNVRVTALTTNPNVPVTYKTIILKKNLVNGVNTLTKEMMSATNTKYVVKYDYALGDDITIPANCVLEFDGGSISGNGTGKDTITGQNTEVINGSFDNIIFSGTFNKEQGVINIHEFGCKTTIEDDNFDNSDIFQNLINVSYDSNVALFVPSGSFLINKTITLKSASVVKGVQRHTHGNSSILVTSIQTADFKMFADNIHHATFDSIGIYRNRTNEESSARTEVWSGQTAYLGYGLAGTAFGSSTELRTIGCSFVGWRSCFDTPSILFSDNTDFGYCENIVTTDINNASTVNIDHANIWCCGQTFNGSNEGLLNCSLTNSWVEYYDSLIKMSNRKSIMGLNVINTTFTTTDTWTDENANLLMYGSGSSWNRVFINFDKCYIKVFGKLLKNFDGTDYFITMDNSIINLHSEEDEDCYIYGNSTFYQDATAVLSTHIKKAGIDSNNGEVNTVLSLNYQPQNDYSIGSYKLYKYAYDGHPITYKDENNNRMIIPPLYLRGTNEPVANPQFGNFFEYFTSLNNLPKKVILRFRNPAWGITEDIVDLKPRSGTFANKPTTTDYNLNIGDSYFCTDKQTAEGATNGVMIYHKGNNVWVDALGRVVS